MIPAEIPVAVTETYRELIVQKSQEHGLDPGLVAAVICEESRGVATATRKHPGYLWTADEVNQEKQRLSWGLMQVMGATAKFMGFTGKFEELLDPATNLEFGCRLLAHYIDRYGELGGVTAYNSGSNLSPKGREYASRVMEWREALAPYYQGTRP